MAQQSKEKLEEYVSMKIPLDIFLYNKPEGTKENPVQAKLIDKVDWFPEGGGIFTYFSKTDKFPNKACPGFYLRVTIHDKLNEAKEIPMLFVKIINESLMVKLGVLISLLLPEKYFKRLLLMIMKHYLIFAFGSNRQSLLNPERYCRSGREIYRVLMKMTEKRDKIKINLIKMFALIFCQIWEFDQHYRTVGQDCFTAIKRGQIKLEDILRNPSKLLDIPAERDVMDDRRNNWKKIQKASKLLLLFKGRFFKRLFKEFMSKLNLDEVSFDAGDLHYYLPYEHYNFLGLSRLERWQLRKLISTEYQKGDIYQFIYEKLQTSKDKK